MEYPESVKRQAQAMMQGTDPYRVICDLVYQLQAAQGCLSFGYVRCPPGTAVDAKPAPAAVLIPGEPGAAPIEDDGA
jgi:hypothetical protein